jgi:hypothetical protein
MAGIIKAMRWNNVLRRGRTAARYRHVRRRSSESYRPRSLRETLPRIHCAATCACSKTCSIIQHHESSRVSTTAKWRVLSSSKHWLTRGAVDEFVDFMFGRLPYRSPRFRHDHLNVETFQPAAVNQLSQSARLHQSYRISLSHRPSP